VFRPVGVATFGRPRLGAGCTGCRAGLSAAEHRPDGAFIVFRCAGRPALACSPVGPADAARYVSARGLTDPRRVVRASCYGFPICRWGLLHDSSHVEYHIRRRIRTALLFRSPTRGSGVLQLDRRGRAGLVAGRCGWGSRCLAAGRRHLRLWLLALASFIVQPPPCCWTLPRLSASCWRLAGVLTSRTPPPSIVRRLSSRTFRAGLPSLALWPLIILTGFHRWQAWDAGGPTAPTGLFHPR